MRPPVRFGFKRALFRTPQGNPSGAPEATLTGAAGALMPVHVGSEENDAFRLSKENNRTSSNMALVVAPA